MTRELSLGQWRILIEVFLSQHHEHCGYHFAPLLFVLFHLDDISFFFPCQFYFFFPPHPEKSFV